MPTEARGRIGRSDLRSAVVEDVSTSGVFVRCPNTFPEGTEVELRFDLPGPQGIGRVEARAEVRHRRGGEGAGMGLKLLRLPFEHAECLRAWMKAQKEGERPAARVWIARSPRGGKGAPLAPGPDDGSVSS